MLVPPNLIYVSFLCQHNIAKDSEENDYNFGISQDKAALHSNAEVAVHSCSAVE